LEFNSRVLLIFFMTRNLLPIAFLLIALSLQAQDFTYDPNKKGKIDREVYNEGTERVKNLLLIPYKPVMHLPDPAGDVQLVIKSEKSLNDLQKYCRLTLDMSLAKKFKDAYNVQSMMVDMSEDAARDLDRIYASVGYKYEAQPVDENEKGLPKKLKNMIVPADKKASNGEPENDGQLRGTSRSSTANHEGEYMNVLVYDTTLIPYLVGKYNADVFVFVNQFEVKKTFAQGSDVAYQNYYREVKVHYTVFDANGKQLYGDLAISKLTEKTDNINEIINWSFKDVSDDIYLHLPDRSSSNPQLELQRDYQKKAEQQNLLKNK